VGLSRIDGSFQSLSEIRSNILTAAVKSILTVAGGLVTAASVVFLLAPGEVLDAGAT
jgi:hypothetical protein